MTVEVNQIIRSRRKTLALIVKPDGSIVVRAPLRAPRKVILEFIEKNQQWIETHQAKALAAIPRRKEYVPGEMFLFLGTAYPLEIVRKQKKDLILDGSFKLAEPAQARAEQAFERWYREQAERILQERVHLFALEHDFQYKRMGITSARTRWGSCSATGSLNFSWRLILAPLEVIDYVVVHELVHTVVHNHSKQFWQRVETILPDFKKHRMWLKRNGGQLLA